METLKLNKEKAKEIYEKASDDVKAILIDTFGEKMFKKTHFTDIKTFNDACVACGTTEKKFNERFLNAGFDGDTVSYEKLKIIARAINQGWIPDWNNDKEYKWWPWFNLSSGFGFSGSVCFCDGTLPSVGSRLCFETKEKSDYAGKQFKEIYEKFLK